MMCGWRETRKGRTIEEGELGKESRKREE